MISKLIEFAEKGLVPDFFIRAGIVRNCLRGIAPEVFEVNDSAVGSKESQKIKNQK